MGELARKVSRRPRCHHPEGTFCAFHVLIAGSRAYAKAHGDYTSLSGGQPGRLPFCNTLGDLLRFIEQLAYESLIFLIRCPTRVAGETMC